MKNSKLAGARLAPARNGPEVRDDAGPEEMDDAGDSAAPGASRRVAAWVPADVRARLDLAELARLGRQGVDECRRLERELGAFVAAYRRQGHAPPPPGKQQLCSLFEAARLTPAQLRRIGEAEARIPGVVLVAYAAPLRRR